MSGYYWETSSDDGHGYSRASSVCSSQGNRGSPDPQYDCETCNRTFRSQQACNQHMSSLDHRAPRYLCETCNRDFASQRAAGQHMNARGHWTPKVPCEMCGQKFQTQGEANSHMKDRGHYRNYCRPCDRKFTSADNLRMVSRCTASPTYEVLPYSLASST